MMMISILKLTDALSSTFIVPAHWNNIPRIDMLLHSDKLSWFWANHIFDFSPYN